MKKVLFTFILALLSISAYSQVTYGEYVNFPNNNFANRKILPSLAFGKVDDQDVICLRYVNTDGDYASFDQSSQLLFKIGDEIIHIPMSKVDTNIEKKYDSMYAGSVLCRFWITYTAFDMDKETVDKIVNQKQKITKIRVIFTNGENKDYDIKEKYQAKLTEGLIKSYQGVSSTDAVRKNNLDNDEAGF